MAIDWSMWSNLPGRIQETRGNEFDFSSISPAVVEAYSNYQAMRPKRRLDLLKKYEEANRAIKEDDLKKQWLDAKQKDAYNTDLAYRRNAELKNIQSAPEPIGPTTLAPVVQPEPSKLTDKVNDAEKDFEKAVTEIKTLGGSGYSPEPKGLGVLTDPYKEKYEGPDFGLDTFRGGISFDEKAYGKTPELRDRWDELTDEQKGKYFTGEPTKEEMDALRMDRLKEALGEEYDDARSAFDEYGGLNEYQRMRKAGEQASIWNPQIGKVLLDASDRMRDDRIQAYNEILSNLKWRHEQALNRYKLNEMPSAISDAKMLENTINNFMRTSNPMAVEWKDPVEALEELEKTTNLSGKYSAEDAFVSDLKTMKVLTNDDFETAFAKAVENGVDPKDKAQYYKTYLKVKNEARDLGDKNNASLQRKFNDAGYDWDTLRKKAQVQRDLENVNFGNFSQAEFIKVTKALEDLGYNWKDALDNSDPDIQKIKAYLNEEPNATSKDIWTKFGKAIDVGAAVVRSFAKSLVPGLKESNWYNTNRDNVSALGTELKKELNRKIDREMTAGRQLAERNNLDWRFTVLDPETRKLEVEEKKEQSKNDQTKRVDASDVDFSEVKKIYEGNEASKPFASAVVNGVKAELEKALNGEESAFKSMPDGTLVGGDENITMTYNPKTKKLMVESKLVQKQETPTTPVKPKKKKGANDNIPAKKGSVLSSLLGP